MSGPTPLAIPPPGRPLKAVSASEEMNAPRPVAIVEGFAWAACVSVLVAESGAGKTFFLLDVAAAIADGIRWHGRQTQPGSVVFISFEGDALSLRLRALQEVGGRRLEDLWVVRASDPISPIMLRDGEQRSIGERNVTTAIDQLAEDLAQAQRPPIALLIVDTIRASMVGSEDRSEDAAAYLRAVRRIAARVPGAAIVLAHHTGWLDGDSQRRRERGSSAWRGNCDATFFLETEADQAHGSAPLILRALKVRDDERPAPMRLIRRRVELLGGTATSCVIERDRRTREDRESEDRRVTDAAERDVDHRVLQVLADHPEMATSIAAIRDLLALRNTIVVAALGRLLRGKLVKRAEQRDPYKLTKAGRKTLASFPATGFVPPRQSFSKTTSRSRRFTRSVQSESRSGDHDQSFPDRTEQKP